MDDFSYRDKGETWQPSVPIHLTCHVRFRPDGFECHQITLDPIAAASIALGKFATDVPLSDIQDAMTYAYTQTPPPSPYWDLKKLARGISNHWEEDISNKSNLQLFFFFLLQAEELLGPNVGIRTKDINVNR